LLLVYVNLLTAVLTFLSLIGYAVFYTMYLKRATPQNIVIGGAAGAAPPILGWTSVAGVQGIEYALLLFLIVFMLKWFFLYLCLQVLPVLFFISKLLLVRNLSIGRVLHSEYLL
jgi:heme O synthase-like polyprenyltransferase